MSQVADYNIANASGASVRSDLNAVFEAIKTCNSGSSDPANPESFMLYVDTADSNKLKIRNAANTAFVTIGSVNDANLGLLTKTGGSMTGQLLVDNSSSPGSAGLSFDGDTDTGIFRADSNRIGFAAGGAHISSIDSNGITIRANGSIKGLRLNDANDSHFVELASPNVVTSSITYTLPATITNGGFLQTDGSGNLSFQIVAGVPSGSVFCMAVATVPTGYLECNGAAVSRTTYAALFAIIGVNYGSGNGSSTFNLPDLRGEFVRGFDHGRNIDAGRGIATFQSGANASHNHSATTSTTTSISQSPHHHGYNITHVTTASVTGSGAGIADRRMNLIDTTGFNNPDGHVHNNNANISASSSSSTSIGNQGDEARPRNIAMMYIIKV